MRKRVYVEAAGCDRRRLDIQSIRRYLEVNGYEVVNDPASADRIVLATCAFKRREEEESASRVRKMRTYDGQLLVYGCLPDIGGERYPELDGVDTVAPRTIDSIDEHFDNITVPFSQVRESNILPRAPLGIAAAKRFLRGPIDAGKVGYRLWASVSLRPGEGASPASVPFNLFVCRGCLGSCSYCAIPRSIGRVHSKDVDKVVAEFRYGLGEGHLIFNVLGDDPGCWGQDCGREFPELLSALLDAASEESRSRTRADDRQVRFRIREIHPKYLTRYGSQITAQPGFSAVEGILVPVQSGSDRVLDLMQREHTTGGLMRTVTRIREAAPGVRMETQVIVGFPSETDDDFASTLDFVRDAGFDSVVVFPYHDKPGTVSSELGDKVAEETIQRRMRAAFKYFRTQRIKAYYSCP